MSMGTKTGRHQGFIQRIVSGKNLSGWNEDGSRSLSTKYYNLTGVLDRVAVFFWPLNICLNKTEF